MRGSKSYQHLAKWNLRPLKYTSAEFFLPVFLLVGKYFSKQQHNTCTWMLDQISWCTQLLLWHDMYYWKQLRRKSTLETTYCNHFDHTRRMMTITAVFLINRIFKIGAQKTVFIVLSNLNLMHKRDLVYGKFFGEKN